MTFKAEIKALVGWNWADGAVDNNHLEYSRQLLEGNEDNQAEAAWHAEEQTLLAGASITLDLTALTRTVLGDVHTLALLTVKTIVIVNTATAGGVLVVGGAGSDEWSQPFGADGDQVLVPLDSPLLLCNRQEGWPVDSANRNLKLTAWGGNLTYSIAIVGTTTAAGSSSSGS